MRMARAHNVACVVTHRCNHVGRLGAYVQATSGGSLYRKSSFLLDSLGKQVFSPVVSIAERPHLKKAFGSSPFDGDGVATRDREVVTDGVLNGYFLSAYSARKLGLQTTANAGGSHNLIVKAGEQDLAGLIRQMDRGLLVTELLLDRPPISGEHLGDFLERATDPVTRPTPRSVPVEEESQDAPLFAPGVRVRHAKFGEGTIAELSGTGREAKVTIDFDDETVGRKRLVVAYAGLERGVE